MKRIKLSHRKKTDTNEPAAPARRDKRPRTKIRTKIMAGFLVFTVVIAVLLWVLQILLLNPFYSSIKKREVRAAAQAITAHLESDELDRLLRNLVIDKDMSVLITDSRGRRLYGYTKSTLSASYLETYNAYDLIEVFNFTHTHGDHYLSGYEQPLPSGEIKNGIIYAATPADSQGNYYLILLDAQITPVDSTIDTLKIQLVWVTAVMLLLGTLLAVWIARHLTRPIEAINRGARQMADGDYSIRFAETGSRETCELAQTLNHTAQELSKVESLRHELLANVSHDLRTPLTMIKGYSEVMRDLPGENTPENIQIIIDEATRLNLLVNDLLDLSRLEAGAVKLELTVFSITDSIRETLNRYKKLSDFTFFFDPAEDIAVRADELKISQVLYNLINNAIHYSREEKVITVSQERMPDGWVRVSVTDRGEGIPADKLADIWERYYKIDKEHRQTQEGTGIGLSIVKNILFLLGGKYGVNSREGAGSTFWFELPVVPEEKGPSADDSSAVQKV